MEAVKVSSAELARMYSEDMLSVTQVAERAGLSYDAARHRLYKAGAKMRTRGEGRALRVNGRDGLDGYRALLSADEIRRVYGDEQMSVRAIASKYGVSTIAVRNAIRRSGMVPRDQGTGKHLAYANDGPITLRAAQIVEGLVLGDGCLKSVGRWTALLTVASKHESVARWISDELRREGIANSVCPYTARDGATYWYLTSRSLSALKQMRDSWYGSGRKEVPADFELTSVSALHWYVGDGGHTVKRGRATPAINLHTEAFSAGSIVALREQLALHGVTTTAHTYRGRYTKLYVPNGAHDALFVLLGDCPDAIHADMGYKWRRAC